MSPNSTKRLVRRLSRDFTFALVAFLLVLALAVLGTSAARSADFGTEHSLQQLAFSGLGSGADLAAGPVRPNIYPKMHRAGQRQQLAAPASRDRTVAVANSRILPVMLLAFFFITMVMVTLAIWRRLTDRRVLMPARARQRQQARQRN